MGVPSGAQAAILKESEPVPSDAVPVRGPDFESQISLQGFLKSYENIGFQATSFGRAVEIVNHMVSKKASIFMMWHRNG
jgi:deoxyhypusine synthase